jgi:hypothetical protein
LAATMIFSFNARAQLSCGWCAPLVVRVGGGPYALGV